MLHVTDNSVPFCYYDLASVLDLTMVMTLVAATLPGMRGPMTEAMGALVVTGLRATVLAKLWRASYLERSASNSTFILAFSVASLSTSCCSWAFCFSSSSFWVTRFTLQLAAYPRFFRVRLRCFSCRISSLERPRRCWFNSRTDMVTSSSSVKLVPFSPGSRFTFKALFPLFVVVMPQEPGPPAQLSVLLR